MNFKIFLLFIFFSLSCKIGFSQITGKFSADNCYAIYLGTNVSVTSKILPTGAPTGHCNTVASQIFTSSTVPMTNVSANDWIYVLAWSDDQTCQGLIGEFSGTSNIKTGDYGWEVFATNIDIDNAANGPTMPNITTQIVTANTSNLWTIPYIGPTNSLGSTACTGYVPVNGISSNAKWIWYNSGANNANSNTVLGTGTNHREYLIFRFPVKLILNQCCNCLDKIKIQIDELYKQWEECNKNCKNKNE